MRVCGKLVLLLDESHNFVSSFDKRLLASTSTSLFSSGYCVVVVPIVLVLLLRWSLIVEVMDLRSLADLDWGGIRATIW